MSRQNKVNPGQYTQRGRLTQDDAARELKQQRAIGSQHTWQPVQKDQTPRPSLGEDDQDAMPSSGKAKPIPPESAKVSAARKTTGKAKTGKATTGKAAKPAAKATATRTVRKAVLARNVGGGGSKPRQAAKRRKS